MQEGFYHDFEEAINFLNKDNKLGITEKVFETYLADNQELSVAKFVNFQLDISQILEKHIGVIFHYLKQEIKVDYQGKNKEVFRRLNNIKSRFYIHMNSMQGAMSTPNRLKGTLFSYTDQYPLDVNVTLIKFNNDTFNIGMDFNMGLNLISQLLENFAEKLNKGSNNINHDEYNRLISNYENFTSLVNSVIVKEDAIKS